MPVYGHKINQISLEKDRIRQIISLLKKEIPLEDKMIGSHAVFTKMEQDRYFRMAKTILVYWSLPDEVHTHCFILKWAHSKTFILPVLDGEILRLNKITGLGNPVSGEKYNIPEPSGENFYKTESI